MKTYYVSRKKWLRGNPKTSALRNDLGQMCCLGFVGQQCGIPLKELKGKRGPKGLRDEMHRKYPKWMRTDALLSSEEAYGAMKANDSTELSARERERNLRAIFKVQGDRIVFKP